MYKASNVSMMTAQIKNTEPDRALGTCLTLSSRSQLLCLLVFWKNPFPEELLRRRLQLLLRYLEEQDQDQYQ